MSRSIAAIAARIKNTNGTIDDSPDTTPDPAAGLASSDLGDHVEAAVDALPDSMRLVLILCYHRGLTHQQSAEILEIPLGTLKTRLHGALTRLRESLALEKAS